MATPSFIHGKLGTIQIGNYPSAGSLFNAESFEFNETVINLEDITYSQAGGAAQAVRLPGYLSATGTITFVYDINNQPCISPFNMTAGQKLVLTLTPDGTKNYSFGAYAGRFRWASGPKAGAVRVTVDFESSQDLGSISVPTS